MNGWPIPLIPMNHLQSRSSLCPFFFLFKFFWNWPSHCVVNFGDIFNPFWCYFALLLCWYGFMLFHSIQHLGIFNPFYESSNFWNLVNCHCSKILGNFRLQFVLLCRWNNVIVSLRTSRKDRPTRYLLKAKGSTNIAMRVSDFRILSPILFWRVVVIASFNSGGCWV